MLRLNSLKLRNAPTGSEIQKTAEEWAMSLNRRLGNPIESIDAPRIRKAFEVLADTSEYWPTPAQFYKVLEDRPKREALPAPDINEEGMEEGKKFLAEIMKKIA